MKVRKTEPGVVRKANISVRKAGQGIRTMKVGIKRGLTSSVIGEEQGQQKKAAPASRKTDAAQMIFRKNIQKQNSASEQGWTGSVEKNVYGKMLRQRDRDRKTMPAGQNLQQKTNCRIKSPYGNPYLNNPISRNGQRNSLPDITYPVRYGNRASGAPETGRTAQGTAVTGKTVMGRAGVTETVTGASGVGGTITGTAGTAVTETAGTVAAGATAAGTGGTVLVVKKAMDAAKKAKNQVTGTFAAAASGKNNTAQKIKLEDSGRPQSKLMGEGTRILFLFALFPVVFFIMVIVFFSLLLPASSMTEQEQPSANQIVEVARKEEAAWEENIGGKKYKDWYGMDADWCGMFVSWCANECDYISLGIMPKAASVASMKNWYGEKEQYHTKESGYEPKAGDVIFFGNGRSHTGLVVGYDQETGTVTTIEGNTGSSDTSPYHQGSRVKEKHYPITNDSIIGYGTPLYPEETIEIPEPYGTEYSYMGWQMITSPSSKQYKLREEAGMNFDADGFGKIGERYVIACTLTFGQVGDYVDWELDNGTVIKTVIGDIKNQNDDGCNKWGHHNGLCVLEFVVDKTSWYGTGKYPTDFHADWKGRTVRATKSGNYWK